MYDFIISKLLKKFIFSITIGHYIYLGGDYVYNTFHLRMAKGILQNISCKEGTTGSDKVRASVIDSAQRTSHFKSNENSKVFSFFPFKI